MSKRKLIIYLAGYIEEEIRRGNQIDIETISNAIDAFEGGAFPDGKERTVHVTTDGAA
jgi:hypothetical protein